LEKIIMKNPGRREKPGAGIFYTQHRKKTAFGRFFRKKDKATPTVTFAGGKMRSMFCRCGRPCAAGGGDKQKQTAEENFGQSR